MSIKICVITPISHLKEFSNLGEMDMSLAHMVLEDPKGPYTKYYQEQSKKGRFVILDNGLFELEARGVGVGIDAVLDAAEITNPSEIIAEDVLFDGAKTIDSTKRFLDTMDKRGVLGKYSVMGVIQGRTETEWMDCFEKMLELPVNTIGLSKLSVPVSFLGEKESPGCVARSRLLCTKRLNGYTYPHSIYGTGFSLPYRAEGLKSYSQVRIPTTPRCVHLLGGDNWLPWEINQQKQYSWIRSNDSSAAVWYGRYQEIFNAEGQVQDIILDKPDLENKHLETERGLKDPKGRAAIYRNITLWHLASKT